MLLGDDIRPAFGFITDLLNTSASRSGGHDQLERPNLLDEIAYSNVIYYKPEHTRAEDVQIRQLRTRLEEFLRYGSLEDRMTLINSLLLTAGGMPQLVTHPEDDKPHFHYTMEDASFSSKVIALAAMGLARLVTHRAEERFRVCEGNDCNRTFIDVSKNGSRRYCDSRTCGNRLHAARYRARVRGGALRFPSA